MDERTMKNGKPNDWKARLERLEADVKEIKVLLRAQQPEKPWWQAMIGIFENDPAAEEVDRLIRENREKERQKARRRRRKTTSKS